MLVKEGYVADVAVTEVEITQMSRPGSRKNNTQCSLREIFMPFQNTFILILTCSLKGHRSGDLCLVLLQK